MRFIGVSDKKLEDAIKAYHVELIDKLKSFKPLNPPVKKFIRGGRLIATELVDRTLIIDLSNAISIRAGDYKQNKIRLN